MQEAKMNTPDEFFDKVREITRRLDMKQEPVAWMETYNGHPNNLDWNPDNLRSGDLDVPGDNVYEIVPLYTAPRELSDEEIWELHQEHIDEVTCGHSMKTVGFIEFARAILKKASEK
jgi:hypothetical protein